MPFPDSHIVKIPTFLPWGGIKLKPGLAYMDVRLREYVKMLGRGTTSCANPTSFPEMAFRNLTVCTDEEIPHLRGIDVEAPIASGFTKLMLHVEGGIKLIERDSCIVEFFAFFFLDLSAVGEALAMEFPVNPCGRFAVFLCFMDILLVEYHFVPWKPGAVENRIRWQPLHCVRVGGGGRIRPEGNG